MRPIPPCDRRHPLVPRAGSGYLETRRQRDHLSVEWTMPAPGCGPPDLHFDLAMMAICLDLARQAAARGEVPVGALITCNGQILAQGHNRCETHHDPTAHAERLVLTAAGRSRGTWRLDGCTLYATLEPCSMCAGAIVLSRLDRLVYGAADPKAGACRSLYRLADDPRLNHRVLITPGIMAESSAALLKSFFQDRRLDVK